MSDAQALIAWANTFLVARQLHAENIKEDFADGVLLINLVEQAFNQRVAKSFNLRPKQHFQKLDNVALVLTFLEKENVVLLSIDGHSIVNGQSKQTVNLLWNILRELTLRSVSKMRPADGDKNVSIKSVLMQWIKGEVGC